MKKAIITIHHLEKLNKYKPDITIEKDDEVLRIYNEDPLFESFDTEKEARSFAEVKYRKLGYDVEQK